MSEDDAPKLDYGHAAASPVVNWRRWAIASIIVSFVSIIFSIAWQDILWSIPDSSPSGDPNLHLAVSIHVFVWGYAHINSISDWWWLWTLPGIAAGFIVIGVVGDRGRVSDSDLKWWAIFLVIFATAVPFLAGRVFYWQFAFGQGPWVN
jgi:hypothetical protein